MVGAESVKDCLPSVDLYLGLSWCLSSKESICKAADTGDVGLIPGSGSSLEEEMATHSSILAGRIPMDREARQATVHRVTRSWT